MNIRDDNLFNTVLTKQGGVGFTKSSEGRNSLVGQYDYDPAVMGYTHVFIDNIPNEMMQFLPAAFTSKTQLGSAIAALSREYVLPEANVEAVNYSGMTKEQTIGALKEGTELTIRFIDTVDLQLSNFMRMYNLHLRPRMGRLGGTGRNTLESLHSNLLIPGAINYESKYHMNAVIFSTDPTCTKIIQSTACFGLWPKKLPNEHLSIAIGDVSMFTFSQNFAVSYVFPNFEMNDMMQDKLLELVNRDHTIV